MRKVSHERVSREVTTILAVSLGVLALSTIGPWVLASWLVRSLQVFGLGWISFRSWTIRDWISDLTLDRNPAEPFSIPLPASTAISKEPPSIRLDAHKSDSGTKLKILLSSEKAPFRDKVALILRKTIENTAQDKVEVLEASTARETLSLATDHVFHLVILDAEYSGDLSFKDIHTEIKRLDKSIPVVLLTELNVLPTIKVDGFFRYPFEVGGLKQLLAYLRRPATSAEVRHSGNKIRHS